MNADLLHALWPLFVFPAAAAALPGSTVPRARHDPGMVGLRLCRLNALLQSLLQMGGVVGPALGGLLLAGAGTSSSSG